MKATFLENKFITFSLREGLSTRNEDFPIYAIGVNPIEHAKSIRNEIKQFLREYHQELISSGVTEEMHNKKLVKLCSDISKKYSSVLFKGKFRLGVAQKIVNLYLKYLWSAGFIGEPHHCPFDGIVKRKLNKYSLKSTLADWTELTTIRQYESYVSAAKLAALNKNVSVAVWELNEWKRR